MSLNDEDDEYEDAKCNNSRACTCINVNCFARFPSTRFFHFHLFPDVGLLLCPLTSSCPSELNARLAD